MENFEKTANGEMSDVSPSLLRGLYLLQEKWVLWIVHKLLSGPLGFNELNRQLACVNTTTLAQRLALLEKVGLVAKTIHSTMPPRTSYELTDSGRNLQPILEAIEQWSDHNLPECKLSEGCSNEQSQSSSNSSGMMLF